MNIMLKLSIAILLFASVWDKASCSGQNPDILVNQTSILLKFFNNPIQLYRSNGSFNYRVSEVNTNTSVKFVTNILVSRLVTDRSTFERQSSSGVQYNQTEMVTFSLNVTNLSQTAFILEIVNSGLVVVAFGYIPPFEQYETSGYRNVTLVDIQFNVFGVATISYLVIRPITAFNPMSNQYSNTDDVFFVGHRATGIGRRWDLSGRYLENTIAAANFVASKGAPMVEIDIQLSADKVPIVFHDFDLKTYLFNRYYKRRNVTTNIALKDFDYKQLQQLSTSEVPNHLFRDPESNQPFETLENFLQQLNPKCGIDVEIKYPQLDTNRVYESEPGIELNEYVDRILQVLYTHSSNRKIVITSFHADLCTMIQLKQNRFRVAFLTSGNSTLWDPTEMMYYDPRTQSVENAVAFVQSFQMKGISLEVMDVITVPTHIDYIKSRNLALYLWGSKLTNYEQFMVLRKERVNAVIFDRFDRVMAGHSIN